MVLREEKMKKYPHLICYQYSYWSPLLRTTCSLCSSRTSRRRTVGAACTTARRRRCRVWTMWETSARRTARSTGVLTAITAAPHRRGSSNSPMKASGRSVTSLRAHKGPARVTSSKKRPHHPVNSRWLMLTQATARSRSRKIISWLLSLTILVQRLTHPKGPILTDLLVLLKTVWGLSISLKNWEFNRKLMQTTLLHRKSKIISCNRRKNKMVHIPFSRIKLT